MYCIAVKKENITILCGYRFTVGVPILPFSAINVCVRATTRDFFPFSMNLPIIFLI